MNAGKHGPETSAHPDRLSRLSEASLRINESLDLDTVLQEVVDSARALTNSAYGVITTLDDSGLPKDFVTSGMGPDAHQALEDYLPEGLLVYSYLSALRKPLRLANTRSSPPSSAPPVYLFAPGIPVRYLLSQVRRNPRGCMTITPAPPNAGPPLSSR